MSRAIMPASNAERFPILGRFIPQRWKDFEFSIERCARCGGYDYETLTVEPSYHPAENWCHDCVDSFSFICDRCDLIVPDDEAVTVLVEGSEEQWCEDCANNNAATCEICDAIYPEREMHYIEDSGMYVCPSCYDAQYTTCYDCDESVELDLATLVDGRAYHKECAPAIGSKIEVVLEDTATGITTSKHHAVLPYTVGVEYEGEWLYAIGKANDYHSNIPAPEPFPASWRFEKDASLVLKRGKQVAEIISPPTQNPNYIIGVIDFINKRYGGLLNSSTGIHVNVKTQLSSEEVVTRAVKMEEAMFHIAPRGRFRYETYNNFSKPLKNRHKRGQEESEILYNSLYEKYVSVKTRHNGLLEFRAFANDGTVMGVVVGIAFINAILMYGEKIDEMPLHLNTAKQLKFMTEEFGWRKGGEWNGFWYDPRNPEKYYVKFMDNGKVIHSHVFELPDEDALIAMLKDNLPSIAWLGSEEHGEPLSYLYYKALIEGDKLELFWHKVFNIAESGINYMLQNIVNVIGKAASYVFGNKVLQREERTT